MRNIYIERMEAGVLEEDRARRACELMRMVIRIIVMLAVVFTAGALFGAFKAMAEEQYIAVIYQDADQAQANAITIDEAPPINRISEDLDEQDANGHQLVYLGEFKLTYYCPCRKCNGSNGAIDRLGNPLVWGTVAVDPKVISLGTQLVIDGYDAIFTARDTGDEWVQGNHIDIFVPVSHSEARKMGQERRKVWRWIE